MKSKSGADIEIHDGKLSLRINQKGQLCPCLDGKALPKISKVSFVCTPEGRKTIVEFNSVDIEME